MKKKLTEKEIEFIKDMKQTKQTVYLLVKVENEKPKYGSKEFTIDSKNRKSVHHTLEILDENKDLYDKNGFLNFGDDDSYVTHWLKPQEAFVFTPEQLNEYKADIINSAVSEINSIQKCSNAGYESKIQELQREIESLKFDRNKLVSDIIKQALEVASENVKLKCQKDPHKKGYPFSMVNPNGTKEEGDLWITANKQSITNTFEETFKMFKV